MELNTKLSELKGVGDKTASNLASAGLFTIEDLLNYFPRKYDDYSNPKAIKDIRPGLITLSVNLHSIKKRYVRRSLHITEAIAQDESGEVRVVWFNQPYRAAAIKPKTEYLLRGEYDFKNHRLQIINPSLEVKNQRSINTIIPTYPEKSGLKSAYLRKVIDNALKGLENIDETLPLELVKSKDLITTKQAYKYIHQPQNNDQLTQAKRRFAFDELFIVMFASEIIKKDIKKAKALPISFNEQAAKSFVAELPFDLTDYQRKVVWQIYKDISTDIPMNRLVEGDVGSGKTVVAAMAALMALEAGLQTCFIAPTEILAQQHHQTIKNMLDHTKFKDDVVLLTGSLNKQSKAQVKELIKNRQRVCIIGTHALLQKDIVWQDLGLLVVDEQHRFGVKQRQSLHIATNTVPHTLCLTATPIPRSLALIVYGELDISILAKAPSIKAGYNTSVVSPNSTAQMYESVKDAVNKGRQAYVVCPAISESESTNLISAEETYKQLSRKELNGFKLGLLHGKMKSQEKEDIMKAFKQGKIDVLVSTTVIEVGVDVPNATEMVILNADRFGLAQLHQLRGRVGRGKHMGHCYLVVSDSSAPTKRMRFIESTNDGFKLAQYDLDLRGPGSIYGTRQHGELDLKFVDLTDTRMIAMAKQTVSENINKAEIMLKYPKVAEKLQKALQLTYLN